MHEIAGRAVFAMMFHQIQTGAEMIAIGLQDRGTDPRAWQSDKDIHQFVDGRQIKGVAFFRTVERHGGNAVVINLQQDVLQFQIGDITHQFPRFDSGICIACQWRRV